MSEGHNSVKNPSSIPKVELDQDIMIDMYPIFHLSKSNLCKENERKLDGATDKQRDRRTAANLSNMPSLL